MFNFFKPKPQDDTLEELEFRIQGMHCSSCAVNIDLTLEELPGVVSSKTNYASSLTKLILKKDQENRAQIKETVKKLGYTVTDEKKLEV